MRKSLPFQHIPLDVPLQVLRLHDYEDTASYRPHRHQFYMLLWVTAGTGEHMINFHNYPLQPGRVAFIHEGQVHRIITQPAEGYIILFRSALFRTFLQRTPAHEQHGLFDYLNREPCIDLDENTGKIFENIVPLLESQAAINPADAVIANYLAILLYQANQLFRPVHPFLVHPVQAEQIRQLKNLIERHYKTERYAPFYSDKLGMVTRKLNELSKKLCGKLVHEMVNDRLLSEIESLLGGTGLTVKEIIFETGFINHAHFAQFFRKQKGMTASAFRQQMAHRYS